RSLWEHIFTLYTRKELQADVRHAVETFAREPSEANFNYLAALINSRGRGLDEDDERNST
ncbi:MAG: hypothetical protein K2X44_11935, partial [Magnetospirillum sp.]|nr:hypothetical protein [Magnetospirillum sp.]